MKKFIVRFLLAVLLAHAAMPALAATYYFSDCQAGAHASCVAGSNANAGTSIAAPKQNLTGFDVESLAAGDQVMFARGAVWDNSTLFIENASSTRANPITFGAYTPPWGGTARPWLRNATADSFGVVFGSFNNDTQDGGYVITGLRFDGAGTGGTGMMLWGELNDVIIDDVIVEDWSVIGLYFSGSLTNHVTFKNSVIRNIAGMGVLGSGTDLEILDSTISGTNFTGSPLNHAIYLGGTTVTSRITLRNIDVIDNSRVGTECRGGNVTAHGKIDQLLIENVRIIQTGTFIGTCYGFSLNPGYGGEEWIRRLVWRGNTVVNTSQGYSCTSCANAIAENNIFVNTTDAYALGFAIPGEDFQQEGGAGQDRDTNITFRGNSAYFGGTPHAASSCFRTSRLGSGGNESNMGTSGQIVDNICHFASNANSPKCMQLDDVPSQYESLDANGCSGGGGWTSAYPSTAAFQARYGATGNITTAPTFVGTPTAANPNNIAITSGSAGVGAGSNVFKSLRDHNWCMRPNPPSIGAFEPTPVTCIDVRAPTGVR